MTIEKQLLWKAFPDGYVGRKGVQAIGDWLCVGTDPWNVRPYAAPRWLNTELNEVYDGDMKGSDSDPFDGCYATDAFRAAVERGELLPQVDLAETATWACLLADLALLVSWVRWDQFLLEGLEHIEFPMPQEDLSRYFLSFQPCDRDGSFRLVATSRIATTLPDLRFDQMTWASPRVSSPECDPAQALVRAFIHARNT